MRYRLFGPTGLRPSELFLGAMTFGYSMSLAIDDRIVATAQSSERPFWS